jgi:hypothetical protein
MHLIPGAPALGSEPQVQRALIAVVHHDVHLVVVLLLGEVSCFCADKLCWVAPCQGVLPRGGSFTAAAGDRHRISIADSPRLKSSAALTILKYAWHSHARNYQVITRIQRPLMQRPFMQRPHMQRPHLQMQRPHMQRPHMQMQRPHMQRPLSYNNLLNCLQRPFEQ